MRVFATTIGVLGFAFSNVVGAENLVMLDRPGVMSAIAKDDRPRYDRLIAILEAAREIGCVEDLAPTLKERFRVGGAQCTGYFATEPPKTRFVFTVEGTRYSTILLPKAHVSGRRNAD